MLQTLGNMSSLANYCWKRLLLVVKLRYRPGLKSFLLFIWTCLTYRQVTTKNLCLYYSYFLKQIAQQTVILTWDMTLYKSSSKLLFTNLNSKVTRKALNLQEKITTRKRVSRKKPKERKNKKKMFLCSGIRKWIKQHRSNPSSICLLKIYCPMTFLAKLLLPARWKNPKTS
jgi:hypothetical protein